MTDSLRHSQQIVVRSRLQMAFSWRAAATCSNKRGCMEVLFLDLAGGFQSTPIEGSGEGMVPPPFLPMQGSIASQANVFGYDQGDRGGAQPRLQHPCGDQRNVIRLALFPDVLSHLVNDASADCRASPSTGDTT
jgi:hypothetical protein